jgi:shikimate dehydrogenase
VIGDPITHSLSPAMHNAAFRHLGLDFAYVSFHVRPAQLKAAVAGFRALEIAGVNVTVPHKEKILRLLDSVRPTARQVGAVNTIINRNGHLHGENTDVYGFRQALAEIGVGLRGKRVVVIGAGGAARAVLVALAEERAAEVQLFNRTLTRGRRLAQLFAGEGRAARTPETTRDRIRTIDQRALRKLGFRSLAVSAFGLGTLSRADLNNVDVIVNTTSIGLNGEPFPSLDYASAARSTVFFDLIPKSGTAFQAAAQRARRPTLDGTGMLLHQGAAAFELWTGEAAPLDVMRAALKKELAASRA